LSELKAVTVISGSFAAGDSKRAATVLNSIDVVTVGGGNADITAAVKTLPGRAANWRTGRLVCAWRHWL
jgi:hypothetical protein